MALHNDLTKVLIALNRGENVNNDLLASVERGFRNLQSSANIFSGWVDAGTNNPRFEDMTVVESNFVNPPLESVFLYSFDDLTAGSGFEEFFFKDRNEYVGPTDGDRYEFNNRKLVRNVSDEDIFISRSGKDRIYFFNLRMTTFSNTAICSCYIDFKDKSGTSISTDFPTYLLDSDQDSTQGGMVGSSFIKVPDNAYSFSFLVEVDTTRTYRLWANITRIN